MPIVMVSQKDEAGEAPDVQSILFDEKGELTLVGEAVAEFLADVDFGPIFDDEEVIEADLVQTSEVWMKKGEDGNYVACEEGDEGATLFVQQEISPEALAQVIDADDLASMFEYFVEEELPLETLEDKARYAALISALDLDEAMLDEKAPFPKGSFRKMRKYAKNQVTRMLLAMLKKEAISRADKPGEGYKSGDYKKHPAGYGKGTPGGINKWQNYKGKNKAGLAATAKTVKKEKAKIDAKYGFGKAKKKAATKKGAAKKAKKGMAKAKGKGKKATIAASEQPQQTAPQVNEGARLAGSMLGKMQGRTIVNEDTKS
jgi:hypothetical protein